MGMFWTAFGIAAITSITSHATTIDFKDRTPGFYQGGILYPSVKFTAVGGFLTLEDGPPFRALCSGPGFTCPGSIFLAFARPAYDISFNISGDNDAGNGVQVLATNSEGVTSSSSYFVDGNLATYDLVSLTGVGPVSSLLISTTDTSGLGYGNFQFRELQTGIPEPSNLLVTSMGIFVVCRYRTKRQNQVAQQRC